MYIARNDPGSGGVGDGSTGDILSRILPDCYLYISHLDTEYQYWMLPGYPEEVADDLKSTFGQTSALGRSAPVYTYSSSGPRTIQINLIVAYLVEVA